MIIYLGIVLRKKYPLNPSMNINKLKTITGAHIDKIKGILSVTPSAMDKSLK